MAAHIDDDSIIPSAAYSTDKKFHVTSGILIKLIMKQKYFA